MSIGDKLNQVVVAPRTALFIQGELTQLTYGAFDVVYRNVESSSEDTITIEYPVGYRADRQPLLSRLTYHKPELLERYNFLASYQLATNGIFQLVTIVEALLGDTVRLIVTKYPKKLGGKRTIPLELILQSVSLEEVHLKAVDALINDLSYLSPSDFADAVDKLFSVDLRECASFHRYIELKASRDVLIHNRGVANEIYLRKAGTHARVKSGHFLPVDIPYFLEAYEHCIQLTEWLEEELHHQWHSEERETRRNRENVVEDPGDEPAAVLELKPKTRKNSKRAKKS